MAKSHSEKFYIIWIYAGLFVPLQRNMRFNMMKKINIRTAWLAMTLCCITCGGLTSCDNGETYADMKEKEKDAIDAFINDNNLCGHINVISEETFIAHGYTTDLDRNEFVVFDSDGIYMQIVRQGQGKSMVEMAEEDSKGEVTKPIVCKFFEYDIRNASTTNSNIYTNSVPDEMLCTYNLRARSYTASFTSGYMASKYGSVVPKGWLKPLDYVKLTKVDGIEAKVRIIVPHTSGTANASSYVLPFYYEITYQLPPNR